MQTEQMIAALVADSGMPRRSVRRQLFIAIAPAITFAALAFYSAFGLRDDLTGAASQMRFLFKFFFMIVLSIIVWQALIDAARPTRLPRSDWGIMLAAWLVFVSAVAVELYTTAPADWVVRLYGENALFCVLAIPSIGLPILALALFALHGAAPREGALAGCVAGLFAGVTAGAIYAVHCPDDSPLFVAAWYGLATGFMAVIGAIVGRYVLRW